jgi:hypothetical protein
MSHPRTHPLAGTTGVAADAVYSDDLHRPLLIVGNGPSAAVPRHDLLPDDPVVFRMNWFFLEDRYHYGDRVDGFFYSIPNSLLEQRLLEVVLERTYDVRALLSPMKIAAGRDGESHASHLPWSGLAQLDHWELIARNPVLGRFMMSRPLPTQGAQALATALELGFRDITLCGIDMYASDQARYGYAIPDEVRAALQPKDLEPGYEDAHSLDRDLDFIDACVLQFPDARIRQIGPSRALAERFEPPPQRERHNTFAGVAANTWQAKPKRSVTISGTDQTSVDVGAAVELPFTVIGGRRCGYVTFVSGPFHHGARALARSLAAVSDVPLLVMCTPSADRAALRASGLQCIDVPEVFNPNDLDTRSGRFAATYGKLNAFRMTHLDRAVYLDSDMIVLRSIDELFEMSGFLAVADHGLDHEYDRFNSGMFAFEPSAALFESMLDRIRDTTSYDGGDQGFLNEFFSNWERLPHEFNVNKRWFAHHPNLFRLETVRVLHYVGIKPWQHEGDSPYDELYHLWFEQLSAGELIDVAESLRVHAVPVDTRTISWFQPIRMLRALWRGNRADGETRVSGSALRRSDALRTSGRYEDAVDVLVEAWPGDDRASADHFRRLGTARVLAGDLDAGLTTLREGHRRYPEHATLGASLRKTEKLDHVTRVSAGLVPTSWLIGLARSVSR